MMNLPRGPGPAEKAESVFGANVAKTAGERPQDQEPEARDDQRNATEAEILEEARKFLDYVEERESQNRLRAAELLRFCYRRGSQWPDKIRRDREQENRPCLEINMMPTFINQVTNDERQNRPSCKVRPASDEATEDVAEIYQDLIRHIEYDSNAGAIYDNAYRYAVAANIGYWRITTCYESEKSFYQKILLAPINNIFSVYYDPNCKEPDGSDAEKCLITEEISKEEFERRYPDAQPIDWQSTDPALTAWLNAGNVRIADYFHKAYWKDALYLLPDGSTRFESDDPNDVEAPNLVMLNPEQRIPWPPQKGQYVAKREVDRCEVQWQVINGQEILEEHQWAGKYIPIVPIFSDTVDIEGDIVRQALVDKAQDSQQMFNFMVTKAAEGVTVQPLTPFIVAEGQIDQQERRWGEANNKTFPYLVYRKFGEDGKELGYGPPERATNDIDMTGTLGQAAQFSAFIRSTTGIADPLQQMQTEDQSGRAILAKERIANTQTFHFVDNLSRAIRFGGRQLVDLIPKIYDTHRVVQLLREDGSSYKQTINQPQPAPPMPAGMPQAMPPPQPLPNLNDLTVGDYDVIVDTGPSYASKRAETANSMMEMVKSFPEMMQVAGDLMVKNMDWPGSEDLSDRLKVMLPPPIQALLAQQSQDPQVVALGQALQQQQQQSATQMQQMGQEFQKTAQKNQELQTQVLVDRAKFAELNAEAAKKDVVLAQRDQDAQSNLLMQMMESKDVQAKIQQEDRKSRMEEFKLMQEGIAKARESQLDREELNLKVFQALIEAIAKLGPQMGQQGAQVAESETPRAARMVESGQASAAAPPIDLSPIHEMAGKFGQLAENLSNGMAQHMGATHGLMQTLADGHQRTLAAIEGMGAAKGAARPRRMKATKQKDGSYIGEYLDDEEDAL